MNEKQLADSVFEGVKGWLQRNVQPLFDRVKALEARAPEKGEPGPQGQQGPAGADGIPGQKGEPGQVGEPGAIGPQGERGSDGKDGAPGADGQPGRDGIDGKDADPAVAAALATDALKAMVADMVAKGIQKELDARESALVAKAAAAVVVPTPRDGVDGKDGQAGKDADPELVKSMVVEAVAALPKPADGRDGANGKDGRDGIDGKSIDIAEVETIIAKHVAAIPAPLNGKDGRDGADGAAGADGKSIDLAEVDALVAKHVAALPKPADGRDGRDGPPGRDAHQIDVLPGIDPTKRYQRGTVAKYRGGEIYAFRGTDPLPEDGDLEKSGWQVWQNAIDDLAIESSDDGRRIIIGAKMTDGRLVTKTLDIPVAIDRGVYKEDQAYAHGDGVTWGGCWWLAQRAVQPGEKPKDGDAWRLAVKAGRDGRDGLRGEKGERGAQGKDGRDLTGYDPTTGRKW